MSLFVNINEKRPSYYFIDAKCIGRNCFHADKSGDLYGCYNRRIRGCPDPLPEYSKERAAALKAEGWRLKR